MAKKRDIWDVAIAFRGSRNTLTTFIVEAASFTEAVAKAETESRTYGTTVILSVAYRDSIAR